ncbi:Acetyltransferase (GNAT) family protein [Arthrobacter sp. ov407]|uniref:GNAT family N-acetyltransferase n=1 Tax=Arthrobacter sp. ov407 TaxID=1761748 RepID=UPI00088254DA|nr:Acetyltransferase (GNAT) family protein [Arthrobacter sp. ov407]
MDLIPHPAATAEAIPEGNAEAIAKAIPGLEALMDAAWPAAERQESGDWVLRAASGVTQRANSVWTRDPGVDDPHRQLAAVREARLWYRKRRLPVIFQIFDGPRYAALHAVLDDEGFTRQSETLVLVRRPGAQPGAGPGADSGDPDPAVEISAEPSAEWLDLWWSVDGRGGADELAVARGILAGCPALYALVRDDCGVPAAVGRLALPGTGPTGPTGRPWGGLYCMATRPDARRQGYGGRIVRALLREGGARGVAGYWLLVMASNAGARSVYAHAGFREASRYLYRQERPKRHLTGC